jgi:hypothetical protein
MFSHKGQQTQHNFIGSVKLFIVILTISSLIKRTVSKLSLNAILYESNCPSNSLSKKFLEDLQICWDRNYVTKHIQQKCSESDYSN